MFAFNSNSDYAHFLYSLKQKFSDVKDTRIQFYSIETDLFLAKGTIELGTNIRIIFHEVINFYKRRIVRYAYEVYRENELLYFYDPQAHPNDPNLASTFPHHKHVPPDIKHNRKPAPNISFDRPNLPVVIQEILDTVIPHQKFSNG